MKIGKSSNKSCVTIMSWLCVLLSIFVSAQPIKPLELKAGSWEGINNTTLHYNILELNNDGRHRFFNTSIVTAFKKGKTLNFTDKEIVCTSSECVIKITKANNEITRLIISPYIETSFKVLEINTDADGRPIHTQIYQLDSIIDSSTVRNFIRKYKERIESLRNLQSGGVFGFWLGILIKDNKPELVTLEVHPEKRSHFTLFINGQNLVNATSFLPEKLVSKKDVIYIETEHPTFANKLIINPLSNNQLGGYMYSLHKGQTLQTGKFSLMRVR